MTKVYRFRKIASAWLGLVLVAGLLPGGLSAQETPPAPAPAPKPAPAPAPAPKTDAVKFQDLEGKLTIDKTPASRNGGVVTSYADMLDKVTPAVVTISSEREPDPEMEQMLKDPLLRRMFPQVPDDRVTGSGILISDDGYILTNNHVVEKAQKLEVHINAMKLNLPAKLIAADPKSDVALIKVDGKGLPKMTVGDSSQLRVGDVAFAVGNPFGLEQTVTMGIVSALGRSHSAVGNLVEYGDFIQTDASINRGNSGGALVDAQGRLIGINTAIQAGMGGGNLGIGFSIPVNMALDIVDRLLSGGGVVRRGFLGVILKPLDRDLAEGVGWKENYGVMVNDVLTAVKVDGKDKETPAARAGFKALDVIMSYEGEKAFELDSLRLKISNTPPNKEVTFVVFRDGQELTLKVTLDELPQNTAGIGQPNPVIPAKAKEFLDGVEIADLTPENRAQNSIGDDIKGVLVTSVDPSSVAAGAGLQEGMVIIEVNKTPVTNPKEAMEERAKFKGNVLLLRVSAGGQRSVLSIRLKD